MARINAMDAENFIRFMLKREKLLLEKIDHISEHVNSEFYSDEDLIDLDTTVDELTARMKDHPAKYTIHLGRLPRHQHIESEIEFKKEELSDAERYLKILDKSRFPSKYMSVMNEIAEWEQEIDELQKTLQANKEVDAINEARHKAYKTAVETMSRED